MKIKNISTIVAISSLVLVPGCAELEKTIQSQTETLTKTTSSQTETLTKTTSERTVENSPADANTKYLLKQIIVKLNNGQTTSVANSRGQTFGVDGLVNLNGSAAPYMSLNQIKDLAEKSNVDVPFDRYQNLMQK